MEQIAVLYGNLEEIDMDTLHKIGEYVEKSLPPHIGFMILPSSCKLEIQQLESKNVLRSLYNESMETF